MMIVSEIATPALFKSPVAWRLTEMSLCHFRKM